MNIQNLPNDIVDKIFKEFGGYAGYRISKTGKVFVWKKIKMDDEEFMKIEEFIERRWEKNISYTQFYNETYEESLTNCWAKNGAGAIRGLMRYIGTVPKDTNWATQSITRLDKHNNRYRFIIHRYYADTNTLVFHYKRKATQSKKDPFKKNLEVEYVIP